MMHRSYLFSSFDVKKNFVVSSIGVLGKVTFPNSDESVETNVKASRTLLKKVNSINRYEKNVIKAFAASQGLRKSSHEK